MKNLLFSTTMLFSFMGLFILSDSGKSFDNEIKAAPPETVCGAWGPWYDVSGCNTGGTRWGTKVQKRSRQCTDGLILIGGNIHYYYQFEEQTVDCHADIEPLRP